MGTQLIETIKCFNGQLCNINWHNTRFNEARKEYFGLSTRMNLANFIKVPSSAKKGLYRCRISYSKAIDKVEYIPHQYRKVATLKLVEDNSIDYHFKYSDRKKLSELFEQRGDFDDIIIVKNGCITDSYSANTLFHDGNQWWTPDTPLLAGTQRARLLAEHKIGLRKITVNDLSLYEKVGLINAMWDLGNMPVIPMSMIG